MKRFFAFVMLLVVVATILVSCGGEADVGTVITYCAATKEEIYEYITNLDSEVYEVIYISYYRKRFLGTPTYYVEYREKAQTNTESELATEHSHTWDVKELNGTIVSFCTECGKLAE